MLWLSDDGHDEPEPLGSSSADRLVQWPQYPKLEPKATPRLDSLTDAVRSWCRNWDSSCNQVRPGDDSGGDFCFSSGERSWNMELGQERALE
jgi:hypothetical protein